MCKLCLKHWTAEFDGAPCAVKVACTVWSGGKSGDNFKGLPIAIRRQKPGYETAHGWRRYRGGRDDTDSASVGLVLIVHGLVICCLLYTSDAADD